MYSRTSIIRPSIVRISGLTELKSCLPTGSTYIMHGLMYTEITHSQKPLILVPYKTYRPQKRPTSVTFIALFQ